MRWKKLVARGDVDLRDWDPRETFGIGKKEAAERKALAIKSILVRQEMMYASRSIGMIMLFHGIDTCGKDGAVKAIDPAFHPAGMGVASFGVPSKEELLHDYFWRELRHVPRRGESAAWIRSHYEDVCIVRVKSLAPKKIWSRRYGHINSVEGMLHDEGYRWAKFFLHISKREQKERLQERRDNPMKRWKFNPADLETRAHWDDYIHAHNAMLSRCSPPRAPFVIVPSDRKWFRDLVVLETIEDILERENMKFPRSEFDPDSIRIK